jgi:hypothetical protein
MKKKIFNQVQIARAVELGLGATSPDDIDIIAADDESTPYRDEISAILQRG